MSLSSPSRRSRTNSALRSSAAIAVIRSFATLNSGSPHSIATSRLVAKHPTPPRPPYWPLSPDRSGLGITSTLFLVGLLGRFSPLPGTVQLPTQLVALPFGCFASPALFGHPLVQRGLRRLATGTFGVELFPDLSPPGGSTGALGRFSLVWRWL